MNEDEQDRVRRNQDSETVLSKQAERLQSQTDLGVIAVEAAAAIQSKVRILPADWIVAGLV